MTTSSTFLSWPLLRVHTLLPVASVDVHVVAGPVEATISVVVVVVVVVVGCCVRGDVGVRMAFRQLTVFIQQPPSRSHRSSSRP